MKKKILKLANSPIKVYPIYANVLSVLLNNENNYGWMLNNFIQLCKNNTALAFYDFNYKLCPMMNYQTINIDFIKTKFDILDLFCSAIDNGYYIYTLVNVRHINAYDDCRDRLHDLFIYGYDKNTKKFYIRDYFGSYLENKGCSFDELYDAIDAVSEDYSKLRFKGCVEMFSLNWDYNATFSEKRVVDSLNDYLNCRGTTCWNNCYFDGFNESIKWEFGLNIYDYLNNAIEEQELQKMYITDYCLLLEHKQQIIRILDYIGEKGNCYRKLMEQIKKICNMATIARNVMLKCHIQNNAQGAKKCIHILLQMKEMEQRFFCEFIQYIF